jgi:hypothetical protein
MESKLGVVFVASAGNDGQPVHVFPALAVSDLAGMLVVGSVGINGYPSASSANGDKVNAWAAGEKLRLPQKNFLVSWDYGDGYARGTSFGKFHYLYT